MPSIVGDFAFEGRRDAAVGARHYRTPTALDRWEPTRRTLRRPRFLHVPRTSERFIYFDFEPVWRR